jgi:hypothetical protein
MVMHSKLLIYLHCSEHSYIRTEPFDVFENETKTIPLQRSKKTPRRSIAFERERYV